MGKKRKRPVKNDPKRKKPPQQPPITGPPPSNPSNNSDSSTAEVSHPVISLYYRQVVTLRQYILQRIPRSSKSRRRRIAAVCSDDAAKDAIPGPKPPISDLASLLDTTLVGIWKELSPTCSQERRRDFVAFTQAQLKTQVGTDTGPTSPQSEIVNFVISSIFARGRVSTSTSYSPPEHLLSHGYRQASGMRFALPCSIPNVESRYPNKNVQMLKQSPWTDVLALLGANGDEIMLKLLLDCGLFVAVDVKKGIYCQISGVPLSSLEAVSASLLEDPLPQKATSTAKSDGKPVSGGEQSLVMKHSAAKDTSKQLTANAIIFSRQRMLYARPQLDANGRIVIGLPKHVLGRFRSSDSLQQTVHVLKYIFPRQFGLQNVFTFKPNKRESAACVLYRNFSSREEEIARKESVKPARLRHDPSKTNDTTKCPESAKIPKRLRGKALALVRQLQNRGKRCCYTQLLRYYCPRQIEPGTLGPLSAEYGGVAAPGSAALITQPANFLQSPRIQPRNERLMRNRRTKTAVSKPKANLTDYATPAESVSAFCRAVIRKLIPPEFFGTGEQGIAHRKLILRHIDMFIHMRRYETLSIHEVCEGMKITQIHWLEPEVLEPEVSHQNKLSASDMQKRREIFQEFIYYVFDSILIPLIRANFYVTESQVHRNRLFYFRHDLWRRLTVQPLANLKTSMFEEVGPIEVAGLLTENPKVKPSRRLGYGSLRLLPKTTGVRPILNLKRRTLVKSKYAGHSRYNAGQSVNSLLSPVYNMLNYEKSRRNDLLGSSMYSIGDIHTRLKEFKESLVKRGWSQEAPLYFVKLDIQSCFDTIPQLELVRLIEKLTSEEEYHWMKYAEVKPRNEFEGLWSAQGPEKRKIWPTYLQRVAPRAKPEHLVDAIANGSVTGRRNTVLIDTLAQRDYSGEDLLDILNEHVRNNLVKIGKKYFRQRNGIPQGSVVSSLLCNLFYAEMERNELGFLKTDGTLLLRLIDDFLLITLDPDLAMRFLQVMLRGQPAYGVSVNPAKSLVNFAASVNDTQIPRMVDSSLFPYCGCLIDIRTLEISKDQDRLLDGGAESATAALSNSLTLESTRSPGRAFHRKALASLKHSLSPMYLDTAHNSLPLVLLNIYKALVVAALKMHHYARSLPARAHPRPEVVVRTIRDVTELSYRLVRGRQGLCTVNYAQVQYLGAAAFQFVLGRKQSRYEGVVGWLDGRMAEVRQGAGNKQRKKDNGALLAQVVRRGNGMYGGWRF